MPLLPCCLHQAIEGHATSQLECDPRQETDVQETSTVYRCLAVASVGQLCKHFGFSVATHPQQQASMTTTTGRSGAASSFALTGSAGMCSRERCDR
jgi:uncharacterized metal-binding protein